MGLVQDLSLLLARFLRGELDVAELRANLAALSWNVPVWGGRQERELVGSIELALAEFDMGRMDAAELKRELAKICPPVIRIENLTIQVHPSVRTAASQEVVRHKPWSGWASMRPSEGFLLQAVRTG